jgi:hypothetical protein
MSDEPLVLTIDYPSRLDRRSHIDRIDPLPHGESIAWLPRAARWHQPGTQPELEMVMAEHRGTLRRYMLLEPGYHNDAMMRAGQIVDLWDDEVGAHHKLIEESEPSNEPEPPSGIEALSTEAQEEIAEAEAFVDAEDAAEASHHDEAEEDLAPAPPAPKKTEAATTKKPRKPRTR